MRQTLAEKVLQRHVQDQPCSPGRIVRCEVSLALANDITAPLAISSLEKMGLKQVFDPNRVALVCDHFTPNKDIASAEQVKVVREFAKRFGITHYYEGGEAGVEHVLLPELGLIGPGDVVVGADSHTCTYGGLGAFATGLGSTDVAGAIALGETWFKVPATILVDIQGGLPPHVGGKDIVLELIRQLGVDGALYKALEFTGSALPHLGLESRLTISNMAIEAGAKVGLFPGDQVALDYLEQQGRVGDDQVLPDPGADYEQSIRISAESLTPLVACPHLPENVYPVSEIKGVSLDQVVIGSCTNGRISDLREAANLLQGRKVARGLRLIVLPATPKVYLQALKDGLLTTFMEAGAIVGPPTCGPCLGGHMGILAQGERALATTNRNFRGRMGSLDSEVYLSGPAVAAASAVNGVISHPEDL